MNLQSLFVPPGRLAVVPIAACLALVAIVFTLFPEALEHAPVAFDTRGLVHHIWHYGLLTGAVLTLVGSLYSHPRVMPAELIGLILMEAALAMNTTSLIAGAISSTPESEPLGGIGIALRIAVMSQIAFRVWILVARPTAEIDVGRTSA